MQATKSFKLALLRHMLVGLKLGGAASMDMSLLERKRTVKLAADAAMALARGDGANWSRALIAGCLTPTVDPEKKSTAAEEENGSCKDAIFYDSVIKKSQHHHHHHHHSYSKILRRSVRLRSRNRKLPAAAASLLARRLVKKRTRVLKRIVPGGEYLDEFSLLEETLDYMVSLRAQVDLMQHLVNAQQHFESSLSSHPLRSLRVEGFTSSK